MKLFVISAAALAVISSAASAERVEGVYTVPAGFGLEEPFDVELSRARLFVDGDAVTFDYRLPKELDGATPQRFRLAGQLSGDTVTLNDTRGDRVSAECTLTAEAYECLMKYSQPFEVDAAGAKTYLEAVGASPDQIAKAQRASDSLQHQAAGIVKIFRRN